MAIAVTPTYTGQVPELAGTQPRRATLVITGLTAAASNTVPHGLPATPRRVWIVGTTASGSFVGSPVLDISTVAAGFDATNLYLFAATGGTGCKVEIEY